MNENELPDFLLFNRMLNHATCRSTDAVHDLGRNITASYPQLLTDILHLRQRLRRTLSKDAIRRLDARGYVPIVLSIQGGYSYVVALLAVLAMEGTAVLMSHRAATKEIQHIFSLAEPDAILVESDAPAWDLRLSPILDSSQSDCKIIEVQPSTLQPCLGASSIIQSRNYSLDPRTAAIVVFTSGTTGPPKGALKAFRFFAEDAQGMADLYGIRCDDRVYHCLPVHHITGTGSSIIPYLLSGACVVFQPNGFDVEEVWERWRRREMTIFSGVPTMYVRLMEHYRNVISKKPSSEAQAYISGARSVRALVSGSSALPRPQQEKWKQLLGDGRQVLERYGSTEANLVFAVSPDERDLPQASVGKRMAGTEVRLSEGDEGEVLVRSPSLLIRYLNNTAATTEAFDEEGFFRTGDVARREGDYYFIEGRVSVDILKSGGYKISALDIEREIFGLDYIAEVAVVGVPDEEFGQRVAAVVRLHDDHAHQTLSLEDLRTALRPYLAGYKLPTLLRNVSEIPKTETGKIAKKSILKQLFPPEGHPDIQSWRPSLKTKL